MEKWGPCLKTTPKVHSKFRISSLKLEKLTETNSILIAMDLKIKKGPWFNKCSISNNSSYFPSYQIDETAFPNDL